ncbi:MAG: hypothetical protein HQK75_08795 [Candidatus Magnetomorum sp.]|nr:hypothetical protein [Candidatus Magnetomorum sp.]
MALDTSLLQPLVVPTAGTTSTGTGYALTSGTTSSSSTALTTTSSSKLGLMSDPTYYTYGSGVLASASVIGAALLTGAVFVGVGLLSYAVTKAALEP